MENTILIVDGDETYRKFLVDFFKARDFFAFGCASYKDAEKYTAGKRFDIAIVDYFIGKDCANKFCTFLAARYQHETALVITSDTQSTAIELDIRGHSPDFFFIKPVAIDNLYAVILRICQSRDKKMLLQRKALQVSIR
jgi:DNA-binding response OmpR family regulator